MIFGWDNLTRVLLQSFLQSNFGGNNVQTGHDTLDLLSRLHSKSVLLTWHHSSPRKKESRHLSGPYWANRLLSRMSTEDIKERNADRGEWKKPRFVSYLWDTFDKPPAERRLLTKLDTALISFGAVGKNIFYLHVSSFCADVWAK